MLIDFQQHYTPPELLKGDTGKVTVDQAIAAPAAGVDGIERGDGGGACPIDAI